VPTSIEIDMLAPDFVEVPPNRLHALACDLVEGRGAGVDHRAQDKPWTVWPLREVPAATPAGSVRLRLRLNWLLDDAPPERLTHGLPMTVSLGKYECRVLDKNYRLCEYERMAAGPVTGAARLAFLRPTYFRRDGVDVVDPDPSMLLRSALRRWNLYTPPSLVVPESAIRAVIDSSLLTVVREGRAEVVERGRSRRWGFTGEALLEVSDAWPAFTWAMRALPFFGVGAGTTRGLGVVDAVLLWPRVDDGYAG
jgi:CRISPR-associated endoribonuclease Cas6